MDEQPEVIHHQMEETRAALAEKLEVLESQVAQTVQSTSEAVQHTGAAVTETVDAVKETVKTVSEKVQETAETVAETVQQGVESVAEAFDLRRQVERYPWLSVGGAVVVGFLGHELFASAPGRPMTASSSHLTGSSEAITQTPRPAQTGWLWDEVSRLRGLAIGAVASLIRDWTRQSIPGGLGQRLAEEVEHLGSQFGGEKIRESA
ncbi:MAG TPA: hypothetical protein VMS17_02485 [Gemmataceae bacterium]|nr:hypothetical protein [Gemmataceae bacterium]